MLDHDDLIAYGRQQARSMARLLAAREPLACWSPDRPDVLDVLRRAEAVEYEVIPTGSNWTYLLTLHDAEAGDGLAVYKPQKGEAPLWDFPYGSLYRHEVAAFELSRLLGWRLVPPTVARDGPGGIGAMQLFIDADLGENYFTLRDRQDELRRMALFDVLANNADRRGGHCLRARDGHIWGIDHGLTFHPEWKLRTVIWDYYGEPIAEAALADLRRVHDLIAAGDGDVVAFRELLDEREWHAFRQRLRLLIEQPCYPPPGPHRSTPWPPI